MPAAARPLRDSPPSRRAAATYTIGELAREFGVTTRAIRFYEDCGLIDPGRDGRNRVYDARDRTRLRLTLRGKRLGLKLAEVKELVDMYDSRRDTEAQLQSYLAVLGRHRDQLELRLADLQATLAEVVAQETAARRLLKSRRAA